MHFSSLLTVAAVSFLSTSVIANPFEFGGPGLFENDNSALVARGEHYHQVNNYRVTSQKLAAKKLTAKKPAKVVNNKAKPKPECTKSSDCDTDVKFANPTCTKKGKCDFACFAGRVELNNKCIVPECYKDSTCPDGFNSNGACNSYKCELECKKGYALQNDVCRETCKKDSNCDTDVKHADGACYEGFCTFACDDGYYKSGSKCLEAADKCGKKTCDEVENGFNKCLAGVCIPGCAKNLGFSLFASKKKGKVVYKCFNLDTDKDNCGAVDNSCDEGYNGTGTPYCDNGKCELKCGGSRTLRTNKKGQKFCA